MEYTIGKHKVLFTTILICRCEDQVLDRFSAGWIMTLHSKFINNQATVLSEFTFIRTVPLKAEVNIELI